jgi:hypothetical protein
MCVVEVDDAAVGVDEAVGGVLVAVGLGIGVRCAVPSQIKSTPARTTPPAIQYCRVLFMTR